MPKSEAHYVVNLHFILKLRVVTLCNQKERYITKPGEKLGGTWFDHKNVRPYNLPIAENDLG